VTTARRCELGEPSSLLGASQQGEPHGNGRCARVAPFDQPLRVGGAAQGEAEVLVERCKPGQPLPQVEEVFNALRRYIETKPPDVSSRTLLLLDRCQVRLLTPLFTPSPVSPQPTHLESLS